MFRASAFRVDRGYLVGAQADTDVARALNAVGCRGTVPLAPRSSLPQICVLILADVYRDGRVARSAKVASELGCAQVIGMRRARSPASDQRLVDSDRCTAELVDPALISAPLGVLRKPFGYAEASARQLVRCWQLRPDLIYAHEVWALPAALAMRLICGIPFIYDAHELYRDRTMGLFGPIKRLLVKTIEWMAFRTAHCVIACSSERASVMHREYGCADIPEVISNVWDPATFACIEGRVDPTMSLRALMRARNPGVSRMALYQGGIGAGRDLETVVRALVELPRDVGLAIIGPGTGSDRRRITDLAAQHSVDERVLLLEPVHPLQLARLTPEADVGIAAYCDVSRNNTLCAPNKLSEYAIAGIPIVGTDQRPIRDFVEKHGNGVVYRAGDVRGCASALRHALVDEPSVAHLRDHARTAAAHVSWEPERARLAAILRSALVPRHTAEVPSL